MTGQGLTLEDSSLQRRLVKVVGLELAWDKETRP
jgi:hypothetical protein